MRYKAICIQFGTAAVYVVQDTAVDVDAIVIVGTPCGTADEAAAAAEAMNG